MYSLEEKKQLRLTFWSKFKTYSNKQKLKRGKPGAWILDKTGIKQLKLKFHFDEQIAYAGIEIITRNLDKRITLYDKLEKLKEIITSKVPYELKWELDVLTSEQRSISRICAIKDDVNIYNIKCWSDVFKFLFDVMYPMEDIFIEYKDYLKYD